MLIGKTDVNEDILAATGTTTYTVGTNVEATFNSDTGELTVKSTSGTGEITPLDWNKAMTMSIGSSNIKTINFSNKVYGGDGYSGGKYSGYEGFFYRMSNLTEIKNISNLDTSKATNLIQMFNGCSSLKTLDLRTFNTNNVTDMTMMFFGCSSLTSLNISTFNTSKVTSMGSMFDGCKLLKNLDLSSFNTSKVTSMYSMFTDCNALTSLNLSNFETGSLTDTTMMFYGCKAVDVLDIKNFDLSKVTSSDVTTLISNCENAKEIYTPKKYPTSKSLYLSSKNKYYNVADMKLCDGGIIAPGTYSGSVHLVAGYKIEYDSNGGTGTMNDQIKLATVNDVKILDSTFTAPSGKAFANWNTSSGGSGDPYNAGDSYTENANLTLYAQWKDAKANVVLHLNDGVLQAGQDIKEYTPGTPVTLPTPTRKGYRFDGWYNNGSFTGEIVTQIKATDTGDKDFYAKWTAKEYTVELEENGGTIESGSDVTSYTYDTQVNLPTLKKLGYTFGGWYRDNAFTDGPVQNITKEEIKEDREGLTLNFYAQWTPKQYTVTLDAKDGTIASGKDITSYTYDTEVELPTPTKAGYTFAGWYKDSSLEGNAVTNIKEAITENMEGLTLYAKWTANDNTQYIIKHWKQKLNGNAQSKDSINYDEVPGDQDDLTGTTDTEVTQETQMKYIKTYDGFNSPELQDNITINGDGSTVIDFYYTRKSYTVTLEKGTGIESVSSSGTVSVNEGETKQYLYEETVTVTATLKERTDKYSYGWENWTGTGVAASNEQTYTFDMPATEVTLKANGTETINKYKQIVEVSYENGDGSFTEYNKELEKEYDYGAEVTWTKEADATYEAASITPYNVDGEKTTQVKVNRKKYQVTLHSGKGIASVNGEDSYRVGQTVTVTAVLSNGYEWSEWTGSGIEVEETNNEEYTFTMPTQAVDLTANATAIQYQIQYELHGGKVEGEVQNPTTYTIEDENIELKQPTKVGYTFTGWTEEGKGGDPQKDVTIESGSTGEKKYIANWEANTNTQYTVNYWKQILGKPAETSTPENYGLIEEIVYNDGTSDGLKTPIVKEYTGFKAPQGQQVTIKADGTTEVDYYYTRESYTVTLEKGTGIESVSSSGSVSENGVKPKQYLYEETVTVTAVEKAGYTWENWTGTEIEGEGDRTQKSYTFKMPATEVTLTASATANNNTQYTIKHWKQKLEGQADQHNSQNYDEVPESQDDLTGTTDTKVTQDIQQQYIEHYDGFNSPELQDNITINGDGSTVIDLYYTRKSYTVTLEKGTGIESVSSSGNVSVNEGETKQYLYEETVTVTATLKERTDKYSYGWENWTGTGVAASNEQTYTFDMPATEVTLKANGTETINKYKQIVEVSYENGDGSFTEYNKELEKEYDYGAEVTWTKEADATYEAASITPYNVDGEKTTQVKVNRKKYQVTLHSGKGIASVNGEDSYRVGQTVTVTAVLSNGYEWSEWTGSGIEVEETNNEEYTFTMPTQAVDLTANATAIQYQIQYELHGGKVEGAEQNPTTYTIEDEDIELKQPTKEGYTFTGWTEEGKEGDPQKDVTIVSGSTGEKKYIANWEANTNTKYTVNYWKQILGKPAETSNSENYELIETKVYNDGTSDQQKIPTVIGYTGFESPQGQEVTIKADGTTEVNYYYTRKSYTVTLEKGTGIESVSSTGNVSENGVEPKQYLYEETVTVTAVEKAGYTWEKWTGTDIEGEETDNPYEFAMPAKEVTLTANATANTNTQYTVKHWKQKLGAEVEPKNDTNYELVGDPQVLRGTTDENVEPDVNNYDGFVSPEPETVQISGDGRAEVNYYYTRRTDLSYTIKYIDKDETVEGKKEIQSEKTVGNQTFESEIDIEESIEKAVIEGYNYDSIDPSDKLTISANSEENVITIYYTKKTGLSYTVKYIDKETMTEIENPKTRGEEPIQNPKVVGGKTFKDEITTSEEIRNDIYGYDYESIDPEDKLIIDEDESQNIINVYYTKKDASVLVHHYLKGTENNAEPTKISPDQTINGKVFEQYHAQPAQDKLAEYELVGDTDNTEGEMTEDQIEVTYYYILRVAKITATTDAEPENEKEYVIAGEKIKYIITIENSGNLSKEVEVKAEIPEGTTFVEGSIKVGEEARSDLGEQNLIDGIAVEVPMKEGETASRKVVSFEVQVKENQQGDIVSTAEIDEQETEEIRIPILEYEKTQNIVRRSKELKLSDTQVTVGDKITYTINVTNTGTVGIENIKVSDKIPEGTKFISAENDATQEENEVNWEIAEIAGGENKEETFTVEVEHLQGTHTIENIAKIDEKETNRVNYEYKDPIILFTSSTTKTSTTDKITSKEDKIHYIIEFNAEIDYFAGDITVKIVDKLPYKIDEKNSDIQEGEYNEEDKTITWYEKIENIDTFTTGEVEKIKVTKEIAINYIFEYTNGEIGSIRNSAQISIKFEEKGTGEIVNPWEQEGIENPGKQPDEDGFIELENRDGNAGDGRIDAWDTDGNGRDDAWDTDGDGKPDAWDTDGDGEPDKWDEKGKGSADVDITIEIPTKVIVHHYIYNPDGEGTMLVADEEMPGIVGQAYTTNVSSNIPKNYRCRDEHPLGYTGYMGEDPIEVTYYYELILPNITGEGSGEENENNEIEIIAIASEVKEDGTAVLTKERGVVSYNIKYTAKIEDYIGKARIEIVDKLPAGIDLSKSEIEKGTYSETNHTITWVEMIEDIDTFASGKTYTKEITKEIEVVYKDQNVIEDLVNEVEGTTTVFYPEEYLSKGGDELGKIRAEADVTVEQNHKVNLKVVKVWEDNENAKGRRPESVTVEIKVAQNGEGITEVLNEGNNWTYEENTLPKYNANTGEKIDYIITEKESVVGDLMYYDTEEVQKAETEEDNITHYTYTITNVYKLTRADLNTSITKTGTEEITEKDQKVNYTINFKTEIKDYAGDGKVKIVDTLPYRIDEENSNLDGGIYDEENNTITWEMDILDMDTIAGEEGTGDDIGEIVKGTEGNVYAIDVTKQIKLTYIDMELEEEKIANSAKGTVELYETEQKDEATSNFDTDLEVQGKVIVKYINYDTNEEMKDEKTNKSYKYEITGKIGRRYIAEKKEIKGYECVEIIGDETGTIREADQEVIYYYKVLPDSKVTVRYVDIETNEDIKGETEQGTYTYEITGKAGDEYETEQKEIPYYIYVKSTENTKGAMGREDSTVIYYYRKMVYNFSMEKTLTGVTINGQNVNISNNQLIKLELQPSEIKTAEIIAKYNIKVMNNGELGGKAKVIEKVPKGFEMVEVPEYWKENADGTLSTEVELEVGESKDLSITLKWVNNEENLGSLINKAELKGGSNIANFEDTDSKDDISEATILVSIKTGWQVSTIITITIIMSMIITGGLMIIIIRKKGQHINDIGFLNK